MTSPRILDRRRFLALGGLTVVAAACSSSSSSSPTTVGPTVTSGTEPTTSGTAAEPAAKTTPAATDTTATADTTAEPATDGSDLAAFTAADFEALGVCTLLAETTAGPFPTRTPLERRDVTEGSPGHPLRLGLRVIDAACNPVPGAVVEIWHADATGDYSEYSDNGEGKDEAEGSTFLRGYQVADADGIVEFHTIYPGWYRGRAVHIHLAVELDGNELLTSQLFFDDAYTDAVHADTPYAEFGTPDTPNAADNIAGPAIATGGLLSLTAGATSTGAGTVALTNLGVAV